MAKKIFKMITKLKSSFEPYLKKRELRRKVRAIIKAGLSLKVIIGAGRTSYDGWIATDIPTFDALDPAQWHYFFSSKDIDRLLAEHVIEHWTKAEFKLFLRSISSFLALDGFIRIAVPDGFHPNSTYIEHVRPNGSGAGADDHKVLYNYVLLKAVGEEAEYDVNLLEYFDESGTFHSVDWATSDGFVVRSARYDHRNNEKPLSYTSIIADFRLRRARV